MIAHGKERSTSSWSRTLGVFIANVLPLVGVAVFDWNLVALVLLYWLELGILSLWALVRALFAGRPSDVSHDALIIGALASKPVTIPIPRTGLGIHLSTLPVLVFAVPLLGIVWFFAGMMTVGVLGPDGLEPDMLSMVVLAAFGIFLSDGILTFSEYFYWQGYREHSAQTAIQGVFMRGAAIGIGGMITAMVVGLGAGSVATDDPITAVDPTVVGPMLLAGIVLVKLGFDLAGMFRDRLTTFDKSTSIEIGWAYDPPTHDSIDPVEADPVHRYRPILRALMLAGISITTTRRHPAAVFIGGFLLLIAALFATGQAWDIVLAFAVGSIIVPVGLLTVDRLLRYGGVEYRITQNAIVAYDRLFRARLWRIEPWDETGLRVERDRTDSWFATSTVIIERRDGELRIPRIREVEPILDVFDRRPRDA